MRVKTEWVRVTAQHPCPVCGRDGYCGVASNGSVARCMRVSSARVSRGTDGADGFIHKLSGDHTPPKHEHTKPAPRLSPVELRKLAVQMFKHPRADDKRREDSGSLGVSVETLKRMGVGYGKDAHGDYSSWPEKDSTGVIVGITRRYPSGRKQAVAGGSRGLSYAKDWHQSPGIVLIVEGGSDTAAAVDAGLCAIGRPSNIGGAIEIQKMIRGRRAIVIGEWDQKPERRGQHESCPLDCVGCGVCFPGRYGAVVVSEKLGCGWVMPPQGCKDFREAFTRGVLWPELLRAA